MTTLTSGTTGTDGSDRIVLGGGSDTIDGGLGSDTINAGAGSDTLIYTFQAQAGVVDYYNGGSGSDTLVLDFSKYDQWTRATWDAFEATLNQRIAAFNAMVQQYKAANGDLPNLGTKSFVFDFGLGTLLQVAMVENIEVIKPVLNRPPVIEASSTLTGMLVEDGTLTAAGQVKMIDADLGDIPLASVDKAGAGFSYQLADGSSLSTLPQGLDIDALRNALTLDEGTGQWIYDPSGLQLDALAAGDRLMLTYQITATDRAGATDTDQIVITLTGTNDAPSITATPRASLTEEADNLVATGALTITDPDRGDALMTGVNFVRFTIDGRVPVPQRGDGLAGPILLAGDGLQEAGVATGSVSGTEIEYQGSGTPRSSIELPGGLAQDDLVSRFSLDTGSGTWSFDARGLDLNFLTAGQSLTLEFNIRVADAAGMSANAPVTITLTGVNDVPTDLRFTAFNPSSDFALPGPGEAIGRLSATDVDLRDFPSYGFLDGGEFSQSTTRGDVIFTVDSLGVVSSNGLMEASDYALNFVAKDLSGALSAVKTVHVITGSYSGDTDNTLLGSMGDDLIYGMEMPNRWRGLDGNDTLFGQAGIDYLDGGSGNDRLYGGSGEDTLTGGEGQDVFVFFKHTTPEDSDTILDFESSIDKIELSTADESSFVGLRNAPPGNYFQTVRDTNDDVFAGNSGAYVVYVQTNGRLYFDFNGPEDYGLRLFAILDGAPALEASDFILAP